MIAYQHRVARQPRDSGSVSSKLVSRISTKRTGNGQVKARNLASGTQVETERDEWVFLQQVLSVRSIKEGFKATYISIVQLMYGWMLVACT